MKIFKVYIKVTLVPKIITLFYYNNNCEDNKKKWVRTLLGFSV